MTEPADTTPEIPGQQELDGPPESFTPEPVTEPVTEAPTEPDPTSDASSEPDAPTEANAVSEESAPPGVSSGAAVQHKFRIIHEQWLPGANNPTQTYTTEPYEIGEAHEFLGYMGTRHSL